MNQVAKNAESMARSDLFDLSGKTALVTGGASGLGYAMAVGLARHGANVALLDIDGDSLERAVAALRAQGTEAEPIAGDVLVESEVAAAVERVVARFGALDVLINNAGIAILGPAEEMSLHDFRKVHELDLDAVFTCSRIAYRHMAARRAGSIINIASMAGLRALHHQKHVAYNTAKAGVVMLTKTLAVEWAPAGIRVNAIAPGYMVTPPIVELQRRDPELWATWMATVPMSRAGDPSELQGAAVFLASDASSYVSGSVIVVDGACSC